MIDFEKMQEEVETKRIQEVFTLREQMLIAFFPCVISEIVWHYVDEVLASCAENKISILKKICRSVKELKEEYYLCERESLDYHHRKMLKQQTERFLDEYGYNFMTLFFSVNNEFKKEMPDYPYDTMRTKAIIAMLFIRLLDEHNRDMDKLIMRKMREQKNSVRTPLMGKLYTCMDSIAGEVGKFDFKDRNVCTAMKVISNKLYEIEFELV